MSQYALSLSLPTVFSADNFIVADCNREAWQWIEAWPDWSLSGPTHALLLCGPAGSGKSHLGHIWAARSHARILPAADMHDIPPGPGNVLIEDIEQLREERSLFHFLNVARESSSFLLLTAHLPVQQLPFTLPDLTSRLLALPAAHISQPDDEVLAGVMRKQFSDRQMKVADDVIAYVLPRMERSLARIQHMVESLDRKALAEHKSITIPFVRQWLERVED